MANININNRILQNQIKSYPIKSEISEALFRLREFLDVSAYKWLSHFKYTDHGVTQAKISTICDLSGISESTFYKVVKPQIDSFFDEPLILKRRAPRKYSHDKTKKVRSSEFKILQPLNKIIYLVNKKLQDLENEDKLFNETLFSTPGVDYPVDYTVESNPEIPCQTSAEELKTDDQKKSFRKNLLEIPSNIFNTHENISKSAPRKIKIKTEIKNYLENFPVFRDFITWSDFKRYEISRTLQLAIIKTKSDIEETSIQFAIKNAVARLMAEYQDKPLNEFLRLLYTFVFNALNNDQEDDSEAPEDEPENNSDEPLSLWDEMKPTFQYMLDNRPIDPRPHQERVDEINRMLEELDGPPATKEELDDQGVW